MLEEEEMEEGEKMERKDSYFSSRSPPCSLHCLVQTYGPTTTLQTEWVKYAMIYACLQRWASPFNETNAVCVCFQPSCSVRAGAMPTSLCIQPHKPHSL